MKHFLVVVLIVLLIAALILLYMNIQAQKRGHSSFYEQRVTLFEHLPISPEDIVFIGNSLTNGGEWAELFNDKRIKNRGISADVSAGVYKRIETVTKGKPSKIFILIGVNDVIQKVPQDTTLQNIENTILSIKRTSPETKVYIQSLLPISPDFKLFLIPVKEHLIVDLNKSLRELSQKQGATYIDLYPHFVAPGTDKLSAEYTNDGLHLLGNGYIKWRDLIQKYINED